MQAAELKKQWDDQAKTKQFQTTQGRLKEISDFRNDPLMTFAGEDLNAAQRKKEQQDQMRRWAQEDMELKAYQEAKLREEDQARAELNRAVDDYRGAQEQEEANMRKELIRRIGEENREAAEARARAAREAKFADDSDLNNSILLNADSLLDEDGYCKSKDAFRGYSKGQMKQMLLENEDLIRQKRSVLFSPPSSSCSCSPLFCLHLFPRLSERLRNMRNRWMQIGIVSLSDSKERWHKRN
jgi:hypothetical protein